jgi:hypothetical protein
MRAKEDENFEEEEQIKRALLSRAEISIWLDDYDDIFSDFDPRHYSHRALSDDFLLESKKAARDKHGALELHFLIPKKKKNAEHEIIIKKRLRDHFNKHALLLEKDIKEIKKKGFLMAFSGILMIMIAAFLLSLRSDSFLVHFMIALLEPAGWFTAWTGLDEIYYTTRSKRPDFEFYKKMEKAEIQFTAY